MKRIGLAVAAGLAALAVAANGEDGKYRTYIIGERAAGMGGAAVALASGVDAAYYNPAGLAMSDKDSLSLSANLYGIQGEKVESGFWPGDDIDTRSVATIPASIGLVRRMNEKLVLGFSVLQPDYRTCDEILSRNGGMHLYNYSATEKSLWFGPSVGWKFDNGFSIGASVFGTYWYEKEDVGLTLNEYEMTFRQAIKMHSIDLLAVLGAQWHSEEGWVAGAAIQTPSLHLWDTATYAANSGDSGYYSEDVDSEHRMPFQATIGVGRQVARQYAFGLDVIYHAPLSYDAVVLDNPAGGDMDMGISHKAVVDFSLGGEYYVAGQYPIRAGLYTAFSSSDNLEDTYEVSTRDVDLYGATVSVGRETDLMGINLGLNFVFGDGHDMGYGSDFQQHKVNAKERQLYVTFNTVYYF